MKRKIITALLIALSLSLIWTAGAQENPASIWVETPVQQAAAGEEVELAIHISGAEGVYGSSFKLAYDPQALEVITSDGSAITVGSFFGDEPNFPLVNTAADGVIEYAMTLVQPAEPVSGDGILGTIKFRALLDTPIEVTPVEASLVAPEFTEINGRMVAQSMNTIVPEIAGQTSAPAAEPEMMSEEPEVVMDGSGVSTASVADALAASSAPEPELPLLELQPVPVIGITSTNPAVILAGVLFMIGIGLLVVSVGLYTRMRGMNLLSE